MRTRNSTYSLSSTKSNSTLYNENGWKLSGIQKVPRDFLENLERTGKKIGNKSLFGSVSSLLYRGKNNARYVLKHIDFLNGRKKRERKKIFDTEVKIGSIRGIEKVGPRILARRVTPVGGNYVMNHAKLGIPGAKIYSLASVRKQLSTRMWEEIKNKVRQFQNITHGQHGDLHGGNILIVKVPTRHGKTKMYIRIIDYGAHRTFKELKYKGRHYKKHMGMKVYNLGVGQRFIKNQNWFKTLRTR